MFSLVLVLALRAAAAAERDEELASPVDKVLELMNSLLTQVKEEGAAEAADYKSFACFCKDTQLAKDTAIKDGNTAENDQLATIEQMTALEASTIQSISDLNTQLDNTEQALTDAGNLRAEQRAKYEKKHTDTVNSVTGVRSAISDITSSTSFVEKEAVVKSAKVVALLKAAAQDPGDASYMQSDPGGKSREHAGLGASSSITEILDMLLDDWSQKAKKLEDEETARKTLYDQQSAELRQMIIDTKGAIDSAEIQLSETKATNAQTKGQLTETKANLHDDTKYLKDLTAQCEAKATEWDQRSAMRAGEIKALTEAIDIVGGSVASTQGTRGYTDNSEPVLLQGGKPAQADRYTDVVFTQLKEVRKFSADQSSREKEMRLEAVTNIKHMAAKLNSVPLNLLAMKIAADPFAKVKELIQQLITRLLTESQNEATQKGWCDTEIGKANTDRDHRMADTKSLSAKALLLEAEKKSQEQTIAMLTDEISSLNADHAEVTRIRESEKAENKKVLEDSREGLSALQKALATLKKFYGKGAKANQSGYVGLMQADLEQSPVAADMASAGVSGSQGNYEGNQAAGTGIIGILQVIESDFMRSIEMAETAEKDSYTQYAAFDKEAKASLSAKERGLDNAKDDLKIASSDLVATLNKLKDNQKLLDMSLMALETLRPACVDTGMSWEEKVARRNAEIDALKEALTVFEDPNGLGFLQKQ
jgi:chromosome segregation ATPase